MSPDEVAAYCDAHAGIGALLVAPAEREGDVRLLAYGLLDDQWRQFRDG
jgi:hypothetical protein